MFYLIKYNMTGKIAVALAVDYAKASMIRGYASGNPGDYFITEGVYFEDITKNSKITNEMIRKLKIPGKINLLISKKYIVSVEHINKSIFPELFL